MLTKCVRNTELCNKALRDVEKHMGHCRVLKGGRITIPKEVRYKLSIKDGDFVDFSYQIWIYLNNQIQID